MHFEQYCNKIENVLKNTIFWHLGSKNWICNKLSYMHTMHIMTLVQVDQILDRGGWFNPPRLWLIKKVVVRDKLWFNIHQTSFGLLSMKLERRFLFKNWSFCSELICWSYSLDNTSNLDPNIHWSTVFWKVIAVPFSFLECK